ncbi:hypothetical protein LTS17_004606 [Exophiala oligosperma]
MGNWDWVGGFFFFVVVVVVLLPSLSVHEQLPSTNFLPSFIPTSVGAHATKSTPNTDSVLQAPAISPYWETPAVQPLLHEIWKSLWHIFCIDCAEKTGLSGPKFDQRHCPCCDCNLPKPDDVDRTRLDPTDDYKTLVLSGLDPPTILDIAARAVSFWQNQSAQEMICQHLSVKDITERNSILEAKLKKAYHEADIEFEAGQKKINELTAELRELRRRYDELIRAYREKDRKLNQTQKLYSTLKQRAQAQNMIPSATLNVSKDVEQTVQSIESARRSDARFLKPELPRQDLRTSTLLKRTPQPMDGTQNSVELLTHQRSGNSVAGSIQAEMSYTRATPGFNLDKFYHPPKP